MSCFGSKSVVSVESIVVVVRERRASGVARAGVEALGLLRRDVRELRHPILLAVCGRGVSGWIVAAAHLPALVWLPFCAGSRARDRAGAATASRGAASRCLARRTVDSLVAQASLCTLGCPPSCETGSWVPGASGASVLYIDLSTARRGPVGSPVFPSSVRAWQIGCFICCFAIWAIGSPQDAATGAQPRRRGRTRPQLPPCQVL